MPRDGRIIDIGYYAPTGGADAGLLKSLRFSLWVGDRICRKARELGLKLGKADHLNCYLVPEPPFGEVEVASPTSFFHPVSLRLDPSVIEAHDQAGRDYALAHVTLRALRVICKGDPERLRVVDLVAEQLEAKGRELEVEHLAKETKRYVVRVHHYVSPLRDGPLTPLLAKHLLFAVLTFEDKTTGFRGTKKMLDFDDYGELDSIVGSVSLKGDVISIRPRRGHNFDVGIEVRRSELLPIANETA